MEKACPQADLTGLKWFPHLLPTSEGLVKRAVASYHVLPKRSMQPQTQDRSEHLRHSLTLQPSQLQLGSKDTTLKLSRSGEAQLREQAEQQPR